MSHAHLALVFPCPPHRGDSHRSRARVLFLPAADACPVARHSLVLGCGAMRIRAVLLLCGLPGLAAASALALEDPAGAQADAPAPCSLPREIGHCRAAVPRSGLQAPDSIIPRGALVVQGGTTIRKRPPVASSSSGAAAGTRTTLTPRPSACHNAPRRGTSLRVKST